MAAAVVAAVVTVVVDDLLQKLSQGIELGPQWGVEAELLEIHHHFSSVRGALPDAESKSGHSLVLQEWVGKLKDAAYDADDLLEELSMEEPLRQQDGRLRRLFRLVDKFLFGWRMRRELGAVAGRLRDLVDPVIRITSSIQAEVREVHEARAIPFVGRYDERERLITLLLRTRVMEDLTVVPVTGDKGCGKTALVREVMGESKVRRYFDVRIWVNASGLPDVNRVAKEIIASLRDEGEEGEEEEEEGEGEEEEEEGEVLPHLLARHLDDRKTYLFVLDDLSTYDWDLETWSHLRSFLEGGVAWGSKILLTTSGDWELETSWCTEFPLRRMDREDTLKLLTKTSFQEGRAEYLLHPKEADRIIDDCLGIPKIIKALGGYLSLHPSPGDFASLLDRLRGRHIENSFPWLLYGGYPYRDLTSGVVNIYNNLPPRIKHCFALCSLFPRGWRMDPRTLAQLWIALGFINNENDRRPLEDITNHYLDVLLQEELFQVKKYDIFGKVKSVTLHPDAHDLAPSVAGWECLACQIEPALRYLSQNHRHLSVMNYKQSPQFFIHFPRRLRTFLHFEEERGRLEEIFHYLIPKLNHDLNHLRVLDLHHMKVDVLPERVWKLKHLRYLDLSGNSTLGMLPPTITLLLNLQTLKLSGCSSLKELPHDMNKLAALRHLYIDGCWKLSLIPRGLGDMKSLNILTDFILPPDDASETADSSDLTDLSKLNDLRGSLRITNLGCYDEYKIMDNRLEGFLDKKSSLVSVELRFMNLPTDRWLLEKLRPHSNLKGLRIHNYGGSIFPVWMTRLSDHLPNLVEIAVIGCENCIYLPPFGHLPYLRLLTIQGLPDLEHLESGPRQLLPENTNDTQSFCNLSSLCITDCPKLNSLPMIPHLMKLTLVNISGEFISHPSQFFNLKTLRLENIELSDHLLEELLRGLISLKELHIGSCHSLVSLLPGIIHLGKLEKLSIWNCKEIDLSKDEQGNVVTELQSLKSLKFLTIYKASKLEHLPEWISHVATLKFFCIRSCPNLSVLPKWIGNLQSLELLELIHCPRLGSWPHLGYPSKLTVVGCPFLESELRREEEAGKVRNKGNEKGQPSHKL